MNTRSLPSAAPPAARLVRDLQVRVQQQEGLLFSLRFNGGKPRPLRHNACCRRRLGGPAGREDEADAAGAWLRKQSLSFAVAGDRTVAPPLSLPLLSAPPPSLVVAKSDAAEAEGTDHGVAPPFFTARALSEGASAPAGKAATMREVARAMPLQADEHVRALATAATSRDDALAWDGVQAGLVSAMDAAAVDVGLTKAEREELEASFVREQQPLLSRQAQRVAATFVSADAIPALLRAAAQPDRVPVASEHDSDAVEAAAAISSHQPLSEAAAFRARLRELAMAARVGPAAAAALRCTGMSDAERRSLVLTSFVALRLMQEVRAAAETVSPRLQPAVAALVAALLRRWLQRLSFCREDRQEERRRVLKQLREEDKERKIRIYEQVDPADREYLREFKKIRRLDWEDLEESVARQAMAAPPRDAPEDALARARAQEDDDARGMYWIPGRDTEDAEGDNADAYEPF
jgi:hypothetical protein